MKRWIPAAFLAAAVYFLISGLLLAELAAHAPTLPVRFAWRMSSWVIAALTIAAHFGWEQLRLRSTPLATALHVSCGVAIGLSVLATAALIRALVTGTGRPGLLGFAIVLWPLVGGLPTFLVTLAGASMLRRVQPRPGP